MVSKQMLWTIVALVAISFGMVISMAKNGDAAKPKKHGEKAAEKEQGDMPHGVYVRIIPFGEAFHQEWGPKNHDGQDILKMIEELKPEVLDRFTTGKPNPKLLAGLRVRIGSDIYESTVSGQLATLSNAV